MEKAKSFDYTALISVYKNEDAQNLYKSMQSILNQTLPCKELVLIKDGKLTTSLDETIMYFKNQFSKAKVIVKVIENKSNLGLARSLNEGIEKSSSKFVARFDSDDVSRTDRMEKTAQVFKNDESLEVVGSWIKEFKKDTINIVSIKRVPVDNTEIIKYAHHRNPMNHMTVTFKLDSVKEVGKYTNIKYFEDYFLWLKMINKGKKLINIPESLVYARVDNGFIKRRSGIRYMFYEIQFQKKVYQSGFQDKIQFVFNVMSRGIIRLLPASMLLKIYAMIRR